MATTVNLGKIAERLQAIAHKLEGAPFRGSAEVVDHQIVLRGEVERAGRREAHSEVTPMQQLFLQDKDVLAESFARLERWAAALGERPAA